MDTNNGVVKAWVREGERLEGVNGGRGKRDSAILLMIKINKK